MEGYYKSFLGIKKVKILGIQTKVNNFVFPKTCQRKYLIEFSDKKVKVVDEDKIIILE